MAHRVTRSSGAFWRDDECEVDVRAVVDGVDVALLGRVALAVARAEKVSAPCAVSIIVTTDEHVRELNLRYRGYDEVTDVLSFPQQEGAGRAGPDGLVALGDVVIALDQAKRQARAAGHSTADELAWLVAHSVLHLLGYDDETPEGLDTMIRRQHAILCDQLPGWSAYHAPRT